MSRKASRNGSMPFPQSHFLRRGLSLTDGLRNASEIEDEPSSDDWQDVLSLLLERERDELLEIARLKLERQEREGQKATEITVHARDGKMIARADLDEVQDQIEEQQRKASQPRPAGAESAG